MGDGWNGDPIEIIPGTPEDVGGLRQSLINMVMNGGNMGASQYGGKVQTGEKGGIPQYRLDPYQLNAGTDPQQVGGTNILNSMAGLKPYKPATNNLYAHPEWGTINSGEFDQNPRRGQGREQGAMGPSMAQPSGWPPMGVMGGQPGGMPGMMGGPPQGQMGQPNVQQALAMLNAKRKNQQFGA